MTFTYILITISYLPGSWCESRPPRVCDRDAATATGEGSHQNNLTRIVLVSSELNIAIINIHSGIFYE